MVYMFIYNEYFNIITDGLYAYRANIADYLQSKEWYIQCIVKETGGPKNKFIIKEFKTKLVSEPTTLSDKIMGVTETSIIRDLILDSVEALARGGRGVIRHKVRVQV